MSKTASKWTLMVIGFSALALCLTSCSKPKETSKEKNDPVRSAPDFGGVKDVYVEAEGHGTTEAEAIDNAILNAAKQVNGAQVDSLSANLKVSGALVVNAKRIDYASQDFLSLVTTQTGGIVSEFKIITPAKDGLVLPIIGDPASRWSVKIGAKIAKFSAPADAKKPRILVATPRSSSSQYELGNGSRSAKDVGNAIREQINASLLASNRYSVLDNSVLDALDAESERLASGTVNAADTARLGQRLAADLLIIPTIERMEYRRHAQQLRMIDKALVSYSGGMTLSFKVVNASTGQVILTDRLSGAFPTTEATTLGAHVDGLGTSARTLSGMTQSFVAHLMQKTFPIAVIRMTGADVILSQGASMVRPGTRYRAILLGEAMTDPQTGQGLGRTESDFGSVVITKADANMSYGRLEFAPRLSVPFRPGLIELREAIGQADLKPVAGQAPTAPAPTASQGPSAAMSNSPPVAKTKAAGPKPPIGEKPQAPPAAKPKGEDPNW